MNINDNDISILIELFINANTYINSQARYSLCDISRTCKEKEMYNLPPTKHSCMEEAITVSISCEKLDQSLKDIGFKGVKTNDINT